MCTASGCAGTGVLKSIDPNAAAEIASTIEDTVAGKVDLDTLPAAISGFTVSSAGVLEAISSRRERLESIEQYKDKLCIGENRRGLVHYRPCSECENPELRELVMTLIVEENDDRWTIYERIAKGNHLGRAASRTLRDAFCEEHKVRTAPGNLYQDETGQWKQGPKGET